MRVYFEIDEETLEGARQFLTLTNGMNKDVIDKAIQSCEENPVEIPAVATALRHAIGGHLGAACIAIQQRINNQL